MLRWQSTNHTNGGEQAMLEADSLGRKADGHWLLNDISLVIQPGQRWAVVGPSGSGKTLLLRALSLLDPLDAGSIRWKGSTIPANETPRFRSRVMYVPQKPALSEGSVEQNLRQPFRLAVHVDKRFDRQRITHWLSLLGRSDAFLAKQERDLSGGEAQLAALLQALQLDPELLLLDEPTAALDAEATALVESLLADWQQQRSEERSIVWVTHNHAQARRVSTSLLQLDAGHLTGGG